ncbi:hypothetical protein TRVA0_001S10154 [Trichomonascus vanleenenianus]|uniref:uncharacterized protein n=1 Tax=Trichomonascus vanleenenianus TaxID=2268995 RepID=UPI003EC971E9
MQQYTTTGTSDIGEEADEDNSHLGHSVDEEDPEALAAAAAAAAAAAQAQGSSSTFNNVAQGLTGHHRDIMMQYWQETINSIEHDDHKFKIHQLPLARIKKVMKADEDVKMISAEAPILFAKGCDIFITELTMRAWIHAEDNKRRTLQRSDIANALQKSDMFDFLIDIVPREEAISGRRHQSTSSQHYPQQPQQQAAEYVQEDQQPPHPPQQQPPQHPAAQGQDYVYQYGSGEVDYSGHPGAYRQYQ